MPAGQDLLILAVFIALAGLGLALPPLVRWRRARAAAKFDRDYRAFIERDLGARPHGAALVQQLRRDGSL